jgi:hypothetical protein
MAARWPQPAPGDIVWCRFPELPRQAPGPKPRPALVLEVIEREDGIEVVVVYGTSKRVDKLSAGEFAITRVGHVAAYKAASLSHDTKFDFKQTARLPWSEEFFAVPPGAPHGQKPLIGTLHASMIRAAAAAHAAEKQR